MKQIILLPFLFLFFFSCSQILAQDSKNVLLVSKHPITKKVVQKLPLLWHALYKDVVPSLPIYKVGTPHYKKYKIRVAQTEARVFKQFSKHSSLALQYYRGADHEGFDYFLSFVFEKEVEASQFLARLASVPSFPFPQAIVVKLEPKKVKCHCFGKF